MNFGILTALTIPEEDNMSLWEELWNYFYKNYLTDDNVYDNLKLGGGSLISVRLIIVGIFIGVCLAAFASVFNKRILGAFVRKLLGEECLSPESGKTLPELGYADKLFIRNGVRRGVNLRRVVRCREEEEYLARMAEQEATYEERRRSNPALPKKFRPESFRVNPDEHHFYIPEDMKYVADMKFEQKGTTWGGAVLCVILMAAALVAVLLVLPKILELVNDLVGALSSSGTDQIV